MCPRGFKMCYTYPNNSAWCDCCLVSPTDAKGLSNPSEVELLRERVYASLEAYCKQKYPDQQGR